MPKPAPKPSALADLPQGWEIKKLEEIVTFFNGAAFKESDWRESGTPIIRIQNLNGSKVFNHFSGEISDNYRVLNGDLLFAWSGSRGTSFGAHIWNGNEAILNQHIFNVKIKSQLVSKSYIFYQLRWITKAIEQRAHGSAGLVHITKKELGKQEILLPPLLEQQRIASILSSMDSRLESENARIAHLEHLKKALMQYLLTGKYLTQPVTTHSRGTL